jgi:hypothetical protein
MNRLQIVQRLRQEAGVSGSGPATLAGLTGELKALNDWATSAWLEIQGLALWGWRWQQPALTLLLGQSAIASQGLPARNYVKDSMRETATGRRLEYMAWEVFREQQWAPISAGVPRCWTVAPNGELRFDAQAQADTALTVEVYANPSELAADTDEPAMPAHLHIGIVWLALQKYAGREEAGTLYQTAEREWGKIKRQLERECAPEIELGGALC